MKYKMHWLLLYSLPLLIGTFFLVSYHLSGSFSDSLTFSDSAKYADVARNIIFENEYSSNFVFWRGLENGILESGFFEAAVLPIHTLLIFFSYLLFGVNDLAVMFVSGLFYILAIYCIFLLGDRIFGKTVGVISALVFAASPDVITYAVNGGSETIFIFEILLACYLILLKPRFLTLLTIFMFVLMYFTRPQAFIYILGVLLFWLLTKYAFKKSFFYLSLAILAGLFIDKFLLSPLDGKYFLYSITAKGAFSATTLGAGESPSDILRSSALNMGILDLVKKIFYNLYNFYRLAPQIVNPYMLALFVISIFMKQKDKVASAFKLASLFTVGLTLLVTATSIPLFRYIHPVIPLIYLMAINVLLQTVKNIVNDQWSVIRKFVSITKSVATLVISFVLVFVFIVGQTLGIIFLDSRFERKTKNFEKPPLYVLMGQKLKESTDPNEVVITNLDTWGSWYGERKTVWFPLTPNEINLGDDKMHFDAIYLTSYLINDSNYFMGEEWRGIFDNPQDIKEVYIKNNYEFAGEYEFAASGNFDNENGRAVLLRRKS